ncbi:anti-sigma-I factor RsgI2-like isoform X1 [Alosa alosa]|uniref:anti-sigma-I factor RsgI2-like isoform X1 n=1 Tax=Alosa alosa TaxID=278164 RepID=UPI0020151388|nr:anti-sigma-I factor RsgI2-like isoform X1 [Alosa alosa]
MIDSSLLTCCFPLPNLSSLSVSMLSLTFQTHSLLPLVLCPSVLLQPSPSSQREVLIIPLYPNATPVSTIHQTSSPSSPQTPISATASSPQTTSNATVSSPRGPGSQLFAELLESHANRSLRKASPEPAASPPREATPSPVATPQSLSLSLSTSTTSNATVSSPTGPAGLQLFAELLESHARRSSQKASGPAASPPRETTPSPVAPPPPVATPQSLSLPLTQQPSPTVPGGCGLGNPQLLKELKQPPPLKHVSAHKGLTTVFSGGADPISKFSHQ